MRGFVHLYIRETCQLSELDQLFLMQKQKLPINKWRQLLRSDCKCADKINWLSSDMVDAAKCTSVCRELNLKGIFSEYFFFFFFFVTNGYQFLADKTTCIRSSARFRFLFFFCNFYCFILLRDFAESSSRRKNTSQCVSCFFGILFQKRGGEGEKKKTIQEAIEF